MDLYAHLKPPEMIGLLDSEKPEEVDERKADIFLFAITALTLAYGSPPPSPYAKNAIVKPADWIVPNEITYRHQSENVSPTFKAMITQCLAQSPNARPSAKELKKHKFFSHAASRSEVKQNICSLLKCLEPQRLKGQPPSQMNSATISLGCKDLVHWDREVETKSSETDDPDHQLLLQSTPLMGDSQVPLQSIELKEPDSARTKTRFEVQSFGDQKNPTADNYGAFKDSGNGDEHTPHDPEALRINRFHVKESADGRSSQPAPLHHPIRVTSTLKPAVKKRTPSRFKVERVEDVGVPVVSVQSPHNTSPGLPPRVHGNVPVLKSSHPTANFHSFQLKEPMEWDKKDVCDWLQSLGGDFTVYTTFFRKAGIDGEMLHQMTDEELIELQVNKKIHRRRILTSIKKLPLDANK